jgi:hypothetical protein
MIAQCERYEQWGKYAENKLETHFRCSLLVAHASLVCMDRRMARPRLANPRPGRNNHFSLSILFWVSLHDLVAGVPHQRTKTEAVSLLCCGFGINASGVF